MIIGMKTIKDLRWQIHVIQRWEGGNGEPFATVHKGNEFYHRDNWTPAIRRLARNLVRVAVGRMHTFPRIGAQLVTWKD